GTSRWLHANLPLLDAGAVPDDLTRVRALTAAREKADSRGAAIAQVPEGTAARGGGARSQSFSGYALAAAGIGILLLGGLTVGPLRAWIREGVAALTSTAAPAPAVERDTPVEPTPFAAARFEIGGPVFRIDFADSPAAGSLILRFTEDDQVSA